MNTLKTTFLMAVLTVILVTAGGVLGGEGGLLIAFIFALIMNGISYWFSDKIVLRMYGQKRWRRMTRRIFAGPYRSSRYEPKCLCPGSI